MSNKMQHCYWSKVVRLELYIKVVMQARMIIPFISYKFLSICKIKRHHFIFSIKYFDLVHKILIIKTSFYLVKFKGLKNIQLKHSQSSSYYYILALEKLNHRVCNMWAEKESLSLKVNVTLDHVVGQNNLDPKKFTKPNFSA